MAFPTSSLPLDRQGPIELEVPGKGAWTSSSVGFDQLQLEREINAVGFL